MRRKNEEGKIEMKKIDDKKEDLVLMNFEKELETGERILRISTPHSPSCHQSLKRIESSTGKVKLLSLIERFTINIVQKYLSFFDQYYTY